MASGSCARRAATSVSYTHLDVYKRQKFGAAPTLREQKFPNVDYYSGIVYNKMGIPTDLFTPLFAMSRVVGWLAHYMEQTEKGNKIFRPKQIYEGERNRKVRRCV